MKVLVFDTETTGLPERGASIYDYGKWPYIIQISYVLYDLSKNEITSNDYYVKIDNSIEIPPGSYEKHKLTHEILNEKGVDIVHAMRQFNKVLKSCDLVVGHNISFDKRMVFVECLRNTVIQYFTTFNGNHREHKPEYCTMKKTTKFCDFKKLDRHGGIYFKTPSLVELYKKLFPDAIIPDNMHNSLVDVLITLKCYIKFVYDQDITEYNDDVKNMFLGSCPHPMV